MNKNEKSYVYMIIGIILMVLILSFVVFKQLNLNDVDSKSINRDTKQNPIKGTKNSSNTIIEFMDFKCPYCKNFNDKIFPKLNTKYISTGKVKFKVVNASILGKDSIKGARAAYAVKLYYPKKYWTFYEKLFQLQPDNEKPWLTYNLIDKQLENLNIPTKKLNKIKKNYKTKGSESWILAKQDKKLYKKYKNKYVPSIYVNGKFVKNPYSLSNIEKHLDN